MARFFNVLLGVELVILERLHELGRKAESTQAQAALSTAGHIVHQSDCPLVQFLLVEKLVLDHVHVDEVAHVGAGVPSGVVGIDIDLAKHPDHLSLVSGVGLGAGGSGGRVGSGVIEVRLGGHLDNGERESIGDLKGVVDVHTDEGAGRSSRESLGAVLDDFHHHLKRRA